MAYLDEALPPEAMAEIERQAAATPRWSRGWAKSRPAATQACTRWAKSGGGTA